MPAGYPLSQYPILNPNTSLAFLSPSTAGQLEATRYLYIGSLSAFVWDILCTLGQDYRLLTRYSINLPTVVYFVSRVSALSYILTSTIFYVAPVRSCPALEIALGCCWAVAAPSTSLLFFFRVKAVFDKQRAIVIFFAVLWFATLGGSIVVPLALTGRHIADTDRCIDTSIKPFRSAGIVASTGYDTLIFIFITFRIIMRTTVKGKVQTFFRGHDLPYISRELLQGGQQYYLITVGGNVLTMAMMLSPSSSPVVRAMFAVPDMALENAMACRVFRDIKLGRSDPDRHPDLSQSRVEITALESGSPAYALRTIGGTKIRPSSEPRLEIRKTVDQFVDGEPLHFITGDQDKQSSFSCGNGQA